jgi:hypothetical protein
VYTTKGYLEIKKSAIILADTNPKEETKHVST